MKIDSAELWEKIEAHYGITKEMGEHEKLVHLAAQAVPYLTHGGINVPLATLLKGATSEV